MGLGAKAVFLKKEGEVAKGYGNGLHLPRLQGGRNKVCQRRGLKYSSAGTYAQSQCCLQLYWWHTIFAYKHLQVEVEQRPTILKKEVLLCVVLLLFSSISC